MAAREFGEKLKDVRTAKGQSQTELGEYLGVGLKQVQRYEKGEVLPDHDKIKLLIDLYNIDFVSLIYDVPRPTFSHSDKYEKLMEERVIELKQDKEWLKKNLEFSLTGISVQAASILAHVATSLELDNEKQAGGNPEMLQQLKKETDRRIGEKLTVHGRKDMKIAGK